MSKPVALVVEDERDLSFLLAQVVKLAGYEVEVIHSGDIALDRLAEVIPDLVLLDIGLPKVLGTDILKHIRGEQRLCQVYVIVVTAFQSLAETTYEQANYVLNKPFDFGQLTQLVTDARSSVSVG